MRRKIKLKAVTSLLNLNFNDVARYVMDLHSKIKKQKKQINRLKLKVKKIVSCQNFNLVFRINKSSFADIPV